MADERSFGCLGIVTHGPPSAVDEGDSQDIEIGGGLPRTPVFEGEEVDHCAALEPAVEHGRHSRLPVRGECGS